MVSPLFPFEGRYLDRDGLRLHYLDEGAGEPVVMLHGNPTWSLYFRALVLALRPTHRAIVPDHIGMGRSDKPGDDRYQYRLQSRIDDLELLLERLGVVRDVTLVMHDWGGMIGMGYALRHPERIARLVVMNSAAFHVPPGAHVPLSLRLVRSTALGTFAVRGLNALARGAAAVSCKRRPMSRELRRAYCAPYDSWAHRIATLRFPQDAPLAPTDASYALLTEIDAGLARFRETPALLCWGEQDFVFGQAVLDEWRARWPQAELLRLPDCGHYVLEDAPEEICARVQAFLRSPGRRAA